MDLATLIGKSGAVRSLYQPIFNLESQTVYGYEALARFPHLPHMSPGDVFEAARNHDILSDLDWKCRQAAVVGALRSKFASPLKLFINIEPASISSPPPWVITAKQLRNAVDAIPVVIELTERALLDDPASVLWAVEWSRAQGCLVALDDVGVAAESALMLHVIKPDIVKLDRSVLVSADSAATRQTLAAVWDYVSDTGATIVCEGIESRAELDVARACGATLGQGFFLGRPALLPDEAQLRRNIADHASLPTVYWHKTESPPPSSWSADSPTTTSPRSSLRRVYTELMSSPDDSQPAARWILVSGLPDHDSTESVEHLFKSMSQYASFAGVVGFGTKLPAGIAGSIYPATVGEFAFVVISANRAVALVGHEIHETATATPARCRWRLLHQPDVVSLIARRIISRLSIRAQTDRSFRSPPPLPTLAPTSSRDRLRTLIEELLNRAPRAQHAAITMVTAQRLLQTVAANGSFPFLIDQLQEMWQEGPALDVREVTCITISDLSRDKRWPAFSYAIAETFPVTSLITLVIDTRIDSAYMLVTLYSDTPNAFEGDGCNIATAHSDIFAAMSAAWTHDKRSYI